MQKKQTQLETTVMSRIERERITMRPKWIFVLGSMSLVLGVVGSAVVSIFLVSLISFSMKTHGPMGEIRYQQIISNFPWWAPFVAIVGLVFGSWLLRKFDFSYKRNFIVIVAIFIFAVVCVGILADYAGVDLLWRRQGFMRRIYEQYDGGWQGKGKRGRELRMNDSLEGGNRYGRQLKLFQ